MNGGAAPSAWRFYRFALFVTGDGERDFLPSLFRPLETGGHCHFRVVHQIGQRRPIHSRARKQEMVGRGKLIPDKDEEIGLKARKYFQEGYDFVVLIDDLEQAWAEDAKAVYARYRTAFDVMLRSLSLESRASVHFLVNMLEAYYFADARDVNAVLGTELTDFDGDVETIPHPKNQLKAIVSALGNGRSFNEIEHGRAIVGNLDVAKVLSQHETCRSLRTAFAWCNRAMGLPPTELFRLADGQLSPVTSEQLDRLPPPVVDLSSWDVP
jgi:hypothetical protein